uniref:Ig-like domain-containing protein n=1 Tax=Lates calcarifer TaxID=8187 RepID=A0A4W6DI90_LATCA
MTSLKFVFYLTCLFLGKMAQMTGLELSSAVHQKRRFISANVGDSVTLRCFYGGDDSAWLFWYKQTPGQKPRLISTFYVYDVRTTFYHGFKNSPRFTLDTENGSHHLMISNLHLSDSATYYCAYSYTFVLKFAEGVIVSVNSSNSHVYFLSGALTFTTILTVLLALSVYKINKRNNCQCTECQVRSSAPSTANPEGHRDADNIHYAALNVNRPNRSRRQRNNTNTECVYSSLKQ